MIRIVSAVVLLAAIGCAPDGEINPAAAGVQEFRDTWMRAARVAARQGRIRPVSRLGGSRPPLLRRLPRLPDALAYRMVGPHLVLRDNEANLIVDFLPDVMPQYGARQ